MALGSSVVTEMGRDSAGLDERLLFFEELVLLLDFRERGLLGRPGFAECLDGAFSLLGHVDALGDVLGHLGELRLVEAVNGLHLAFDVGEISLECFKRE